MKFGPCHSPWRKLLPASLACFVAVLPSSGASQISESARQCFEWFGTLGYPDFKNARWAEVWTGNHSFTVSSDPDRASLHAFVTDENESEFTIVRTDLVRGTLRKTDADVPRNMRIGLEERPFRPFVEKRLASLRQKQKDGDNFPRPSYSRLDLKSEIFVLANACWLRGELDLAGDLYAMAEEVPLRNSSHKERTPMRKALEIELGHAEMWRTVLECGGRSFGVVAFWDERHPTLKSREELAAAFRRIERLFPASPHADDAMEMAVRLERMVEEDRLHPAIPLDAWGELPLDSRIAELVWRLRDQNGDQFSEPGWCDVFGMSVDGDSPAHQLLKIGYPAVPALIEALTDQRLSRSVGCHRSFYFSHTVLTVGDCARQILVRITGRDFNVSASRGGTGSDKSEPERIQEQARAWWAEFQSKGKKRMLVDSIASGEIEPWSLVRQLEAEDPDAVVDALMHGAAASSASGGRFLSSFIDELAKREGPEPVQFLKEAVREHPDPHIRLRAARHLLKLDFESALPAILAEWKRFPADGSSEEREHFSAVVALLVGSGDAGALRALVVDWESRNLVERFQIVATLGDPHSPFEILPIEVDAFKSRGKGEASPEAQTVAIELLVQALEDTEVRQGYGGTRGDFEFENPQVGDFALWALNRIDGETFKFSPRAGRRLRDHQRVEAANRWRSLRGMSLLPLPEPPGPVLPESGASKVVSVLLEPDGFAEAPLALRALGLKGEDFGDKTLSGLLSAYLLEPVAGTRGLAIEAYRRSDLTGVELTLRFEEGKIEELGRSLDWVVHCRGVGGEPRAAGVKVRATAKNAGDADIWQALENVVKAALSSPPDTYFEFEASVRASGALSVSF